MCCLQETHRRYKDTYRLTVKSWGKDIPCIWKGKKGSAAILLSEKIGSKPKTVIRDREGQHIVINESI